MTETFSYDHSMCSKLAAFHGHLDMLIFFLKKEDNDIYFYNELLKSASAGGNINVIKFLINQGANNFIESIEIASQKGNFQTVKYLLNKTDNWRYSIFKAKEYDNYDIVNLLKKKQKQIKYKNNFSY